jgi:hypothetical protein
MAATKVKASELDHAITLGKLRLEQLRLHVRALANHPEEAAQARAILGEMLARLARLRRLRANWPRR